MGEKRKTPNLKLQGLRLNAGLSVGDLALRSGVSAPTIRLAERGHTPGPRVQFAIAQVFELAPLDIWPLQRQLERV